VNRRFSGFVLGCSKVFGMTREEASSDVVESEFSPSNGVLLHIVPPLPASVASGLARSRDADVSMHIGRNFSISRFKFHRNSHADLMSNFWKADQTIVYRYDLIQDISTTQTCCKPGFVIHISPTFHRYRFASSSPDGPESLPSHPTCSRLLDMNPTTQRRLLSTLDPIPLALGSPRTNIRPRKLPRRHTPLKQNIQLTVRPPARLRKSKIRPKPTQCTHPRPKEARLAPPVPRRRIQHIRHDDAVHDAHHVIHISRQDDGFGLQARGGDLGDEGVADGPDGDVVGERVDEEEAADAPGRAFGVRDGDEADEEQEQRE
jgi:hypothetical protein